MVKAVGTGANQPRAGISEAEPAPVRPTQRSSPARPSPAWDHGGMTADPSVGPGRFRGTALAIRDPLPWDRAVQVVRASEETGYAAVFVPEIRGREAFSTLAGFAGATTRVLLGTGVVTIRRRTPETTAMAAATVQESSGGRLILGIGSGSPSDGGGSAGSDGDSIDQVRAYVEQVRKALSALELDVPHRPPIWLAALGDRMLALAGAVTDGVILNWCTPDRVATARRILDEAGEAAGRDPGTVTVSVYVRASLGLEEAVAVEGLREITGRYAAVPHYRRQMEAMGLGEEANAASRAFRSGRSGDVPEALVRALTVMGGREGWLERQSSYRSAGADLVVCYPVPVLDPISSILGTALAAAPSTAVER